VKKTFRLFSIFHIPIEINYSWFIILGLVIFTLAKGYFPVTNPELGLGAYWLMAVISALLLFVSLLAHELAHSLIAQHYNISIRSITLFVFGGVAQIEKEPQTPTVEFQMAIAGPILSFFLSFVFYSLTRIFYYLELSNAYVSISNYLFMINFIVGIFNLIPGFPLDGGRVLRSIIWFFSKDLKKATTIATGFGKFFAYALMALGFVNLLSGSILSGIWIIFIGLFLLESAEYSYKQVILKKMLSGIKVSAIMTPQVITLPADIKLDKLINEYFFRFRHSSFPILENDTVLGLITFHDIKNIPRENWANLSAKDAMQSIDRSLVINKDEDVTQALAKLANNGLGRALVIENDKLIGIISQRDIMRLFEFKTEIDK